MFRRRDKGPAMPRTAADGQPSSNIKMLVIAASFLLVTIALILMQSGPGPEPVETAAVTPPQSAVPEGVQDVTRANASLLDLRAVSASDAVSRQLRQPIRLTDSDARHTDLRSLTAGVLAGFGHTTHPGDRLQALLVQALTEGQSNAYIDALLNTAAARGEFTIPMPLRTAADRLDTETLLMALIHQSQG